MEVVVIVGDKRSAGYKDRVKKAAESVLNFLKIKNKSVEIVLVSQKSIKEINKKFRNKNKPTNVLSFENNLEHGFGFGNTSLGEIFISTAYINKNKQNLEYMIVHGILHLLGFNHEKRNDKIIMEKKEKEIMNKVFKITKFK